jgi:GNAT superfamily N-acetyltransferase
VNIEAASASDAQAISHLVRGLAPSFTLDPSGQGAEAFMDSISADGILRLIAAPNFMYFKGSVEGELAGVLAVRDNAHLYHLFVHPGYQGRGVARGLWLHARARAEAAGNPGVYTVNSTPAAVPVYEKFGFRTIGPRVETLGIAYVPMRLEMLPA